MPHNRFYIDASLTSGMALQLEGDQHHYFKKVLRGAPGDTIEIINGKGSLAEARVENVLKSHSEAVIISSTDCPAPLFSLTLAIAFLKPSHLEYALEKATEAGASRFLLFPAARSDKKSLSNTYLQRLSNIVEAATKQCGTLFLPQICIKDSMIGCIEPDSMLLYGDFGVHTTQIHTLSFAKQTTFFIGPESGFTESECKKLQEKGALPVSLHKNTLRAETAVLAATLLIYNKNLSL